MNRFIVMNTCDNVATALNNCPENEYADIYDTENNLIKRIKVLQNIPFGNKIAIRKVNIHETIKKYGTAIGEATKDIPEGDLVHVHNVKSLSIDIPDAVKVEIIRQMEIKEF